MAIPVFWLGLVLQYFISYRLGWLPDSNYYSPGLPNPPYVTGFRILDSIIAGDWALMWDTILHLVLPVFCLTFITVASITRQMRSSMLEVLELDYIRTARAKGCNEKTVINKHAYRNALIPTVTIIGLDYAGLLSGAVLTETTFNLRGLGALVVQAINGIDYYVINGCVFLITIIFVLVNLFTDLLYGLIDPRIRY